MRMWAQHRRSSPVCRAEKPEIQVCSEFRFPEENTLSKPNWDRMRARVPLLTTCALWLHGSSARASWGITPDSDRHNSNNRGSGLRSAAGRLDLRKGHPADPDAQPRTASRRGRPRRAPRPPAPSTAHAHRQGAARRRSQRPARVRAGPKLP